MMSMESAPESPPSAAVGGTRQKATALTFEHAADPVVFSIISINLKFIALAGGVQLSTVAAVAHPTKGTKQ
jgi:hypothetical protein